MAFDEWIHDRSRRVYRRTKKLWSIVSPSGVKELGSIDQVRHKMDIIRVGCAIFVIVLIVSLILTVSILVWSIEDASARLKATIFSTLIFSTLGYNGLVVATCVTVSFLITVTLLTVVCWSGVLQVTPNVRKSFEVIVAWIGYLSMAGLLIAALVPLVATPDNTIGHDQVRVSPAILIDIPAGFAVIGYILGMVIGATMILSYAKNLLLRRVFPAIVYVVVMVVSVKYFDVTPREIFSRATSDTKSMVTSCDESLLEQHLDDGAFFIHFIRHCDGRYLILNNVLYLRAIVGIVCVVSAILFIRDVVVESQRRDLVKGV
jgi:membrane protein